MGRAVLHLLRVSTGMDYVGSMYIVIHPAFGVLTHLESLQGFCRAILFWQHRSMFSGPNCLFSVVPVPILEVFWISISCIALAQVCIISSPYICLSRCDGR